MIKSKYKNFIIPLVVYPFDVMVSMAESDEQLAKQLTKYNFSKDDIKSCCYENHTQTGRCVMASGNQLLVRVKYIPKTNVQYATLQHEIFHCVQFLMDKLQMPLCMDNCEAYAYLIQYLTQEIYSKI